MQYTGSKGFDDYSLKPFPRIDNLQKYILKFAS